MMTGNAVSFLTSLVSVNYIELHIESKAPPLIFLGTLGDFPGLVAGCFGGMMRVRIRLHCFWCCTWEV